MNCFDALACTRPKILIIKKKSHKIAHIFYFLFFILLQLRHICSISDDLIVT